MSINDDIKKNYFDKINRRLKIYKKIYGNNALNKIIIEEKNFIEGKKDIKLKDLYNKLLTTFINENLN